MLAAVGVDYGWQPDGTTSSRGDNIEYIVQIAPEQLQQIRSIGEITSTIDPSVQGRVSRIVVKVGNGPLPRIAGRATVSSTAAHTSFATPSSTAANSDQDAIPRPEILDPVANKNVSTTALAENSLRTTESLMKPDPQGSGGFALPESLQSGASSAFDQVRSGANEAATQFGTQVRSAIEAQANALGQSAADTATRATDSLRNSFTTPGNLSAGNPNAAAVPTSPMAARDNRWSDLSTRTAAATGQGPSTDPVAAGARTAPWSIGAATVTSNPGLAAPSLPPSGFGTSGLSNSIPTSDPRSLAPTFGGSTADFRNPATIPAATTSSDVSAREPTDPNWSGYGTSTNFGTVPGGLSVPQTGFNSPTAQSASMAASTTAAGTRAASNSEFWQDASGRWLNNKNQLVNSDGQPIDRHGNRLDSNGYPVDLYGRRVDDNNQVIPESRLAQTTDSRTSSTTSTFSTPFSGSAAEQLAQQQRIDQQRTEQQLIETQRELLRLQQREKAQTRLVNFDDETSSASDLRMSSSQLAARAERERMDAAAASKPKSVAAQPFFNFVLLISLVGNFYLIYETSNLRRKFRNMISSVRSSKVIAQPATN